MKTTSLLLSTVAAALLAVAVLANAQTPEGTPPQGAPPPGGGQMRNYPAPTNLKVLPKDTTGKQIHETMETWAGSLGVHCDTCHMADPNKKGPNGRPSLNFPDDSKADKNIARLMYTMTQQINKDYISKAMDMDKMDADEKATPVTCGTCHRGHKMPEEYVIPPEGPRPGPGGPPPAGATPPAGAPPPSN